MIDTWQKRRLEIWLFSTHFLLRCLTWLVFRARTQNHPQVIGTCVPMCQNCVFEIERPELPPPPLIGNDPNYVY